MGAAQTEEQWLWLERSITLASEWMARQNGDIARADELATRVVTIAVSAPLRLVAPPPSKSVSMALSTRLAGSIELGSFVSMPKKLVRAAR